MFEINYKGAISYLKIPVCYVKNNHTVDFAEHMEVYSIYVTWFMCGWYSLGSCLFLSVEVTAKDLLRRFLRKKLCLQRLTDCY